MLINLFYLFLLPSMTYVILTGNDIRRFLKTLKFVNCHCLFVIFLETSFFSIVLHFINVNLLDLLLFKLLQRSDLYAFLNEQSLSDLASNYSFNFLYFFHPFLKLISLKAYDMPMGTYLISQSNFGSLGGPNTHLPVVLYVIGNQGVLGYSLIFAVGFFCSLLLLYSRKKILKRIFLSDITPIFWPFFVYTAFPLLLKEPSAFAHYLFFNCISYFIIFRLRPSFLQVLK